MYVIKYDRGRGTEEFLKRYTFKDDAQVICVEQNKLYPAIHHWVEKCIDNDINTLASELDDLIKNQSKINAMLIERIRIIEQKQAMSNAAF